MSPPRKQIFRQAALDRLSSPEQLDKLVPITDRLGWAALATVLVLLAGIVTWAVAGRIPQQVEGKGILVSSGGGIVDAMSPSDGTVIRLLVAPNSEVQKGQDIAVIEQTTLREEIKSARETLAERQAEKAELEASFEQERSLTEKNNAEQAAAQRRIAGAASARASYLQSTLKKREELAAKGLLPRDKVEEIKASYSAALQDASTANNRVLELEAGFLKLQSDQARELTRINQRIAEAERQIREAEARLELYGRVLAPISGRITEFKAFEGGVVRKGDPIASIATFGSALQAVLYIPTKDGKRVLPGMAVRLAPSTVKKEEHGTILGTVGEVSEFPATREGMRAVLQNEQLVTAYAAEGAPYAARIDLVVDPATPSGFRWTSGEGPPLSVTAGTTVEAEVTVREIPPVELIIPFVRKHTGIGFWTQSVAE